MPNLYDSLRAEQQAKLREALNKAFGEMLTDGTYKKINDKYFKIDVYGK